MMAGERELAHLIPSVSNGSADRARGYLNFHHAVAY